MITRIRCTNGVCLSYTLQYITHVDNFVSASLVGVPMVDEVYVSSIGCTIGLYVVACACCAMITRIRCANGVCLSYTLQYITTVANFASTFAVSFLCVIDGYVRSFVRIIELSAVFSACRRMYTIFLCYS